MWTTCMTCATPEINLAAPEAWRGPSSDIPCISINTPLCTHNSRRFPVHGIAMVGRTLAQHPNDFNEAVEHSAALSGRQETGQAPENSTRACISPAGITDWSTKGGFIILRAAGPGRFERSHQGCNADYFRPASPYGPRDMYSALRALGALWALRAFSRRAVRPVRDRTGTKPLTLTLVP